VSSRSAGKFSGASVQIWPSLMTMLRQLPRPEEVLLLGLGKEALRDGRLLWPRDDGMPAGLLYSFPELGLNIDPFELSWPLAVATRESRRPALTAS